MKSDEIQVGVAYKGSGHTIRSVRIVKDIVGNMVTYVVYDSSHGQRAELINAFARWAQTVYVEGEEKGCLINQKT